MKKILFIASFFIALIYLLTIPSPSIMANEVNLFDHSKITQATVIDYDGTFMVDFTYVDSSLVNGYYKLEILSNISVLPSRMGYTTSLAPNSNIYFRNNSIDNDDNEYVFGYEYNSGKLELYVQIINGTFYVLLEHTQSFYETVDGEFPFEFINLYLELSDLDPIFTWSQGTLEIPYYDLKTINEIKALISVNDPEDGDLTSSIVLYDDNYSHWTPDGTLPDDLYLIFSVTDSSNNVAYLQIDIEIIDDIAPIFFYDNQEIVPDTYSPNSYTLYTLHIDLPLLNEYEMSNALNIINDRLTVYNYEYWFYQQQGYAFPSMIGLCLECIFNTYLNNSPYPNIADDIVLTYTIYKNNGTFSNFALRITFYDSNSFEYHGPQTIQVPYYDLMTEQEIISLFTASDDYYEYTFYSMTLQSAHDYFQFIPDGTLIGSFYLIEFINEYGIKFTSNVFIEIIDDRIPEVSYSQEFIDEIGFTYSVEYAQNQYITILIDLKYEELSEINMQKFIWNIMFNDYSLGSLYYYNETGFTNIMTVFDTNIMAMPELYLLVLQDKSMNFQIYLDSSIMYDLSDNPFEIMIDINLIDEYSPEVTSPLQIVKSKTAKLTETEIRSQLVITDNVDDLEDLTITKVSDTYTGKENKIGRYEIQYRIEDTSGNFVLHTVVIWVLNIQPPVWVLDSTIVTVTINEPITSQQLLDNLSELGLLSQQGQTFTIEVLSDDFTGSENISGQYMMQLLVNYSDGSSEIIELRINVTDFEVQPTINTDTLNIVLSVGGVGLLVFGFYRLVKPKKRNRFMNR